MTRYALILCVISVVWAHPSAAQELSGSFMSNSSGESFSVESNSDGTADIYGSDGRHVGEAQDSGDGTWDIQSPTGRQLGEIQDNGDEALTFTDRKAATGVQATRTDSSGRHFRAAPFRPRPLRRVEIGLR